MNRIKKYYLYQKNKGHHFFDATYILPKILYNRKFKRDRIGVITGFRRFDLPLLASYSNSGTNWLRYIIEWLSQQPTPGQFRLLKGNNFVIDRAHKAYPIMNKYKSVILIIRDYRECLLRHHKNVWGIQKNVKAFLNEKDAPQPPKWYIKNIEAFDKFEGKKLLIYYEDLIFYPHKVINSLTKFLSLRQDKTKIFLENIDYHYKNSVNIYMQGGHASKTSSKKSVDHHAKVNLTPEQIIEFDEFYFSNYPYLASKYLSRYDKR